MTQAHTTFLLSVFVLFLTTACFGEDSPVSPSPTATVRQLPTREPPTREPTEPPRPPIPTTIPTATRPSDPTPRPTTTAIPPATRAPEPDLSFHFGDDVPIFERTLIITAIEVTRDLLAADARVSPSVTVFAHHSLEGLLIDYTDHARAQPWRAQGMVERLTNSVAEASYRGVIVNTGHPAWRILTDADLMRAVAHEYVHVVQLENAGSAIADQTLRATVDSVPPAGPLWLLEGSAEVVSYLVADRLDLVDYPGKLVDLGIQSRGNPVPLANLETYLEYYAGGDAGIARSVLASDYLMRNRDLSQLFAYWADIRSGATWQNAFNRRFGTTPDAFYANFDAYYNATYAR